MNRSTKYKVSATIRRGSGPSGTDTAENQARVWVGIANRALPQRKHGGAIDSSKANYKLAYENLNRAFYEVTSDRYFDSEGTPDTRLSTLRTVKASYERLSKPKYAAHLEPKEIMEVSAMIDKLDDKIERIEKKKKEKTREEEARTGFYSGYPSLESSVAPVIAIAGIVAGLFFLSSSITGNAIANLTSRNSSFIGVGLLIAGFAAGFFWFKSREK